MVLFLLGCRAIVAEIGDRVEERIEERIEERLAEELGVHAPSEGEDVGERQVTVSPVTDLNVPEPEIVYAPCPVFSPYDQVGATFHWEQTGLKHTGSVWRWDQEMLGEGEYNGLQVWLMSDQGYWYTDGGTYQYHWDRVRAFTCEDDGAHLVYEEGTELVVSHVSASTDYFTEFSNRPLLMPREVEVDTSWTVEGVTWPEYPDGRWIHDDSVREHIGRGEEEKETGMGTLMAYRMKMMLSDSTYTYYWPMAGVGMVVDHNGLAVESFTMPE